MYSRANTARRSDFSAAPSGRSAPLADSRTADVFFRSPNPRRLAGRIPPPESRITSRRPRLSRQRRSSARKTAASQVELQYERYGTQVRSKSARRAKRGRRPIQPSMRALLPPMRRAGFAALSRPTARQADTARVYAAEPPPRPRADCAAVGSSVGSRHGVGAKTRLVFVLLLPSLA